VRGSNNYGPYQYPEKLIPLVISNLVEKKKIPIHGKGQQIRSWLHVNDFCSAIDIVAHNAKDFELYNVSGEARTNIEIIDSIAKNLGVDPEPLKDYISDRPGGDFRYAPNSKKLQTDLGWERKHSLKDHLGDVVNWYINNQAWWQKVKSKREFLDHYESQSKGKWY
jgi:dTDP-glucose 4,6-dehydratase